MGFLNRPIGESASAGNNKVKAISTDLDATTVGENPVRAYQTKSTVLIV